jgi:hypothetical protein
MPRAIVLGLLVLVALAVAPVRSNAAGEPTSCDPPCRSGFSCKAGACVSLCNPPCPSGERCVGGECEPSFFATRPGRESYFGLLGVFHAGLSPSAAHMGEVRIEFASQYTSLEIGPAFGENLLVLRSAIQGHVAFQPSSRVRFFLIPTVALGYSFGWLDDGRDGHQQDIFITPGLRLRYDPIRRLAIMLDLIQVQVTFLRLYSAQGVDVKRVEVVPVSWNLALGLAFLY